MIYLIYTSINNMFNRKNELILCFLIEKNHKLFFINFRGKL